MERTNSQNSKHNKHQARPIFVWAAVVAIGLAMSFAAKADVPNLYRWDTPLYEWGRQIGTSQEDRGSAMALDSTGNIYMAGVTDTYSKVHRSFLMAKYDTSGSLLWSINSDAVAYSSCFSMALDASGNIFTAGATSGWFDGKRGACLTKFDNSGAVLWTRAMNTSTSGGSYSVSLDAAGNAYIGGYLSDTASLAKFNGSGDLLWSKSLPYSFYRINAVAADSTGNLYASGWYWDHQSDRSEALLAKFDPLGNPLWTVEMKPSSVVEVPALTVDNAGNVYVAGNTYLDLCGVNAGGVDAFLMKYDASGKRIWGQQIGSARDDTPSSIAVDANGNIYLTGSTTGVINTYNAGYNDAFLVKFDASGNPLQSWQIGTTGYDMPGAVAVDAAGNTYIGGYTSGSLGDPSAGGADLFLIKNVSAPEPATLSLLVLGSLAALRRRRAA